MKDVIEEYRHGNTIAVVSYGCNSNDNPCWLLSVGDDWEAMQRPDRQQIVDHLLSEGYVFSRRYREILDDAGVPHEIAT